MWQKHGHDAGPEHGHALMQVISISKWISGCYADHAVENTFLVAQPIQLVALTSQEAYWGGPLWRPWNPLRFWRLVLGPSMDKIFPRVVIRLAASHCS